MGENGFKASGRNLLSLFNKGLAYYKLDWLSNKHTAAVLNLTSALFFLLRVESKSATITT